MLRSAVLWGYSRPTATGWKPAHPQRYQLSEVKLEKNGNPVILPFAALTEKTKPSGRDASSEAARSCRAAVGRSAQRWRSIMMPPSEEQHSCAQRVPVKHKRGACCLSLSVNMPFPPRLPPGSSRHQNNRRSRRVSFNGKKMQ